MGVALIKNKNYALSGIVGGAPFAKWPTSELCSEPSSELGEFQMVNSLT